MQASLGTLIEEYSDNFSYSVKGRSMDVPPMEFDIDTEVWEANPNRAASRLISIEKQAALSALIDELLEKEVIRESDSMVSSTPGTETERRMGLNDRL